MSAVRKPYRVERRISWMECDRSGRIRHQVVFDWVVDAEVALLRRAGVLDEVYDDLPRVAVEARYLVPLGFDDPVVLELSVTELGRSSATYAFQVSRDGAVCVGGTTTVVYVRDGRAAAMPEELRAALEPLLITPPAR
jgi:acyl-CoA thioester hydrolase